MRYRKLDAAGDYVMGHGAADLWTDDAQGVAQAVKTRLMLFSGEWFLDVEEGTPWMTKVLGKHRREDFDPLIRRRILETRGVRELTAYESAWDAETRQLTISATITTVYGQATVNAVL